MKDTLKAVEISPGSWVVCRDRHGPVAPGTTGTSAAAAWEKLALNLYGRLNTLLEKLDLRRRP